MIKSNFHTHTKRCGHAIGEDEEYVINAIKGGLCTLGFSDHAPFSYELPKERMKLSQLDDYKTSILSLKEKYSDQLEILLGLECEVYLDEVEKIREYRHDFDYLICGQHQLSLYGKSSYTLNKSNELHMYADILNYGASRGMFDCFAHPDVCMWEYPRMDEACTYVAETIAQASIQYDIPVELNCGSGVKRGLTQYEDILRYPYPTRHFFNIFAKYNSKVIIGLDIHDPSLFLTDKYINKALSVVSGLDLNIIDNYNMLEEASKRKKKFAL